MIRQGLIEQVKCRFREFIREPSAFFWVVLMPLLWMVGLGFAFSDPKPEVYGIGVPEQVKVQNGLVAKALPALEGNKQIRLKVASEDQLLALFQRGDIVLVVTEHGNGVVYRFDPVNPEAVRARNFVDNYIQRAAGRSDPIASSEEAVKAVGGRYVDFLIPGLLGLSIMTSSLFGVGMTIVSNRRENLLKRYCATPMRTYEYIVSHIVGRLMVLVVEFSFVLLAGIVIFRFKVFGSIGTYFLLSVFGASAFTALALLCASRTKSMSTVSGLTNLISLPMMMLSGVFFSKNNFPEWLKGAVNLLPLTALNDALRKVALEGQGLNAVIPELTVLLVVTVLGVLAARVSFRWY